MRRGTIGDWEGSTAGPPTTAAVDHLTEVAGAASVLSNRVDPDRSAWAVVANQAEDLSDQRDYLSEQEHDATQRAAALLQVMTRLRETLLKTGNDAPLDSMVEMPLMDALVLSRFLLERLR